MLKNLILGVGLVMTVFASTLQAAENIDGWDKLKFGMNFEDVLKARPDIPWSDLKKEACRKKNDPYISYCQLKTPWDTNFSVNIADVPFRPWLDFNEENKLVLVNLISNESFEETPKAECIAAHKRVHDILEKRYGVSAEITEVAAQYLKGVPHPYITSSDDYATYKTLVIQKANERLDMSKTFKETGVAPRVRQYEPAMAPHPLVALEGHVEGVCYLSVSYAFGK